MSPGARTERTVAVGGGVELHAVEAGPADGPGLVLVHGFPLSHRMWDAQLDAFGGDWRVVAYDLRGLGRSDVGDGQYTMELMVDDLLAVLDTLALEDPVACGLSMGGYVLLRALQREGARFRAAVLCDTRSGADDDRGRRGRVRAIRTLREEGAAAYAEEFAPAVLGPTTLRERPEVVEAVKATIRDNPVRGMIGGQLAMMSRTDTTGVLPRLGIPLLTLAGDEDPLTPPEVAREMAVAAGPRARVSVVPRAGHLPSMENPRAFDEALGGFLEALSAGVFDGG